MSDSPPREPTRHETTCVATVACDGTVAVRRLVRCTVQAASISPETCMSCPRLVELALTDKGAIRRVHCRSDAANDAASRAGSAWTLPRSTVGDLMHKDLLCLRPELALAAAAAMFVGGHRSAIPVVDEDQLLIGLVRERDIPPAVPGRPPDPRATVGDVMWPYVLTLPEQADVAEAAAVLAFERQDELAIVDGRGAIVGLLSAVDILAWLGACAGHGPSAACSTGPSERR